MKIAYFVNDFPSYTQTFVLHQIVGMIERGHQVSIYARRKNDLDTLPKAVFDHSLLEKTIFWKKVPKKRLSRLAKLRRYIIALPKKSKSRSILPALNIIRFGKQALSLKLAYDALPFLVDGSFDIIHCQFGMLGPIAVQLRQAGFLKARVVTSFRGFDTDQYLRQHPGAYRHLFSEGDLFLPVQAQFGKWLMANGAPVGRVKVLRSGIDCGNLAFTRRIPNHRSPVRLISVARLVEKKGLRFGIDAVAEVANRGYSVQYDIIGDGPLWDDHTRYIRQQGLTELVRLHGWLRHDEALRYMGKAHLLLAPSVTADNGDKEGIPNVIKEAMAMGLPVVSTWHSGIPELITDGENGLLVPEKNSPDIAKAIIALLESPELGSSFAKKGRRKIEDQYDIEKLNDDLEQLYSSAVSSAADRTSIS